MKKNSKIIITLVITTLIAIINIKTVSAHCPLCTLGAAAAAGGAKLLGVKSQVIGLMIGAFAASMGIWVGRIITKKTKNKGIIKKAWQEKTIITITTITSFITTIIPLQPILSEKKPWYVSITGTYGSMMNRTYLIDVFLWSAILGAAYMTLTPSISKQISKIRGKTIPYQGIMITFAGLIITGIILQII